MTEQEHILELRLRRMEHALAILCRVAITADEMGVIKLMTEEFVQLQWTIANIRGISQDDSK